MKNRPLLIVLGLLALAAVAVVWYLASPLFIDDVVEEAFPFEPPAAAEMAAMSPAEKATMAAELEAAVPDEAALAALDEAERDAVGQEVMDAVATVMPEMEIEEPMPEAAEPVAVLQGQFAGADSFHQGSGSAAIYRLPDGSYVLRLDNFQVTNGPDLHVILSGSAAPISSGEVMAGYLDLGQLKGNIGNQNYEIPAGTDVSQFLSVVIYCVPFHVIFATAILS